jgi:hypothetical protein
VYCGPVLRHPAELMLPAVDLGGRVWRGSKSCKGGPAAPAFGGLQIPVHRGQSFRRIADSVPVIADSF